MTSGHPKGQRWLNLPPSLTQPPSGPGNWATTCCIGWKRKGRWSYCYYWLQNPERGKQSRGTFWVCKQLEIAALYTNSPSQRHTSTEHGGMRVKSFDMLYHVFKIRGIGCAVGDRRLKGAEIAGVLHIAHLADQILATEKCVWKVCTFCKCCKTIITWDFQLQVLGAFSLILMN